MVSSSFLSSLRFVLWALVLVAAFAAGAIWLGNLQNRSTSLTSNTSGPIAATKPFTLTAHTGEVFESKTLAGHPYLIFFGFTHCPDICPTTLLEVSNTLESLGEDGNRLKVLFVTIDPERDTAELLKAYLSSFDPRIVGLTGPKENIQSVANQYGIFYEKALEGSGDYSMNHTASAFLYNADGRLVSTLSFQESADTRKAKVLKLIAQ